MEGAYAIGKGTVGKRRAGQSIIYSLDLQFSKVIIMIDLIQAATLTNDPSVQKKAEAQLFAYRDQRPQQFFLESVNIFSNTELSIPVRQSAGTLLVVTLKTKQNDSFLWYILSVPDRNTFKDFVLNVMIEPERLIRRAAANIIAAICCIELPNNEWPGIVQKLTSNINYDNLAVKQASILTIGYMCEQIKDYNFVLEDSHQEAILVSILTGVRDTNLEIVETAFKALRDGLPAMNKIMQNPQFREYLLSQLIEAIAKKHFLDYCVQALLQFVKNYFSLIQPSYFSLLTHHIAPIIMNTKEESSCTVAMQFWGVFAHQQYNIESNPNMNKFITGQLGDRLVEVLLTNLCHIDEQDEDGNGISQSAASALQAIFEGGSEEYQKKVLMFTETTIKHESWQYRQASIRAFALLLIGLPAQRSQNLVNSSLLELVSLLNDQKQHVKLSAIKSLSLISEEVPEVLLKHAKLFQILDFVIKMAKNELFTRHVCKIIDCLCESESSNQILGPHAAELIKVFMDLSMEEGRSVSSITSCFNVIINLIKCSKSVPLCNDYLQYIIKTFPNVYTLSGQKRQLFSSGFLTIAQVCLMTIRKGNGSITMEQLSTLYNLVVEHYKKINDVDGDGFYLISALAFFIPNDRRLIDDFWKYIEFGLKKINQDDIFRATISCVCDFAATYGEQISDKIDILIESLCDLYQKNMITRELKLDVLMCIGELFLRCGEYCYKYMKRVMDLLYISCQGVFSITDTNYAQSLQEAIIETLMCVIHGITNPQFPKDLATHMQYITEFIRLTTEKEKHPKLQYVQSSIMLLADIANLFPGEKERLIQTNFITDRYQVLQKFNKDGHLNQALSFIKQEFRIPH